MAPPKGKGTHDRWGWGRLNGERDDVRDDYFALAIEHFELPDPEEHALVYDGSQPLDSWLAARFPV